MSKLFRSLARIIVQKATNNIPAINAWSDKLHDLRIRFTVKSASNIFQSTSMVLPNHSTGENNEVNKFAEQYEVVINNRYDQSGIYGLTLQLQQSPTFNHWMKEPHAIFYYGSNKYAANVRIAGLANASGSWNIPFLRFYHGQEKMLLRIAKEYSNLILIVSHPTMLSRITQLVRSDKCRVVVFGRYFDEAPRPELAIGLKERQALDTFKDTICLAISEFSQEGNLRFSRGYLTELGIPVLSFPWAVCINSHIPVKLPVQKDMVFIGTYGEKAQRIEAFLAPLFRKYTHTIIGPDWSKSSVRIVGNSIVDTMTFQKFASNLYSSHVIAPNIHQEMEIQGYTCNERTFNSIACGGFQISDNARRVRDFFDESEIITASTPEEYGEKVAYFIEHPGERLPLMHKAIAKIYRFHTYHHRLADLLSAIFVGAPISEFCPIMKK